MSAPQFTPGPWLLKRMTGAEELAGLKGETLAEHEGYYRTNSGAWIVTFTSDDEDIPAGPVCEVSFKGSAKRGEMWCAPDPEGQANARLIAAAPELYDDNGFAADGMEETAAAIENVFPLYAAGLLEAAKRLRVTAAKARGDA